MGRVRFVASTCWAAWRRLALQVAVGPDSTVPNIGASGAIAAVLGGYIAALPARPRADGDLHHLLLHAHRAPGAALPRDLVRPAGPVRLLRLHRPGRRRRRRGVLRAHRRLRVRRAGDPAVRRRASSRLRHDDPGPRCPSTERRAHDAPRRGARVRRGAARASRSTCSSPRARRADAAVRCSSSCCSASGVVGALRQPPPREGPLAPSPSRASRSRGLAGCGGAAAGAGPRRAAPAPRPARRAAAAGRQRPASSRAAPGARPLRLRIARPRADQIAAALPATRRGPGCCSTSTPGAVLWRRDPTRRPADRLPDEDDDRAARGRPRCRRARGCAITREALHYRGSGVGVLPKGKRVRRRDDAARAAAALGQRRRDRAGRSASAGTQRGVRRADERARAARWAWRCTRFASPERLRRRRQPLLRGRPGRARARRAATSRAWRRIVAPPPGRAARSRSRAGTL